MNFIKFMHFVDENKIPVKSSHKLLNSKIHTYSRRLRMGNGTVSAFHTTIKSEERSKESTSPFGRNDQNLPTIRPM